MDDHAAELAKVMIVGAQLRDAHEHAETALELHASVAEVRAIVLSKGGRTQPTLEAVLCSLGMKRDDLSVDGCTLQCTVSTARQPWLTVEGTVDPAPPGHTLVVTWSRIAEDADAVTAMVDDEADVEGNLCRVAVLLDPAMLLPIGPQDRAKLRCAQWAQREAGKQLQLALALDVLAQPPMTVGERVGRHLEVSLYQQLGHAYKALRASGRVPGVCYRPWANDGGGTEIATAMTWLNVPLASLGLCRSTGGSWTAAARYLAVWQACTGEILRAGTGCKPGGAPPQGTWSMPSHLCLGWTPEEPRPRSVCGGILPHSCSLSGHTPMCAGSSPPSMGHRMRLALRCSPVCT